MSKSMNDLTLNILFVAIITFLITVNICNCAPEDDSSLRSPRLVPPEINTNVVNSTGIKSSKPDSSPFHVSPEKNTDENPPLVSTAALQANNTADDAAKNQQSNIVHKQEEITPIKSKKDSDDTKKKENLSDLEPMNSAEHSKDQKVHKKQLKDHINNDTKVPTERPVIQPPITNDKTENKSTSENDTPMKVDLSQNNTSSDDKNEKAGATKRGVIVFGSLSVVIIAYIVFKKYRKNPQGRDSICFDASDPQFKYGILNSNETGDNMEMDNVPLTIDSDDDDELEIFDLEGRKQYARNDMEFNSGDHLLAKDDVEILDLDLPGYSRLAADKGIPQDDDLLNLDNITEDVLKTSVIDPNKKKTEESDNFLNML